MTDLRDYSFALARWHGAQGEPATGANLPHETPSSGRSSSRGIRWCAVGIRAGLNGYDSRPAHHPGRWDWNRTSASLALAQRYAVLTPQQRAIHDAYAASDDCPRAIRDLMPEATRMAISSGSWRQNTPVAVEPLTASPPAQSARP